MHYAQGVACGVGCPRGCCASYREHVASIGIAAAALPTRKSGVIVGNAKDSNLGHDRDAYKRMRESGLQPERLQGAAEVESKAETRLEVERGVLLNDAQREQVRVLQSEGVSL